MTDEELIKMWNSLNEEDKKQFKADIMSKISDAMGETGQMRLEGKLSWKSYKIIMDEFINQNPAHRLYMQGKLE